MNEEELKQRELEQEEFQQMLKSSNQPKVPGGKSYTRVFTKAYQNKDENKAKLENDVNWMKSKGYLKEMTDEVENKTQMSGSGLSNL